MSVSDCSWPGIGQKCPPYCTSCCCYTSSGYDIILQTNIVCLSTNYQKKPSPLLLLLRCTALSSSYYNIVWWLSFCFPWSQQWRRQLTAVSAFFPRCCCCRFVSFPHLLSSVSDFSTWPINYRDPQPAVWWWLSFRCGLRPRPSMALLFMGVAFTRFSGRGKVVSIGLTTTAVFLLLLCPTVSKLLGQWRSWATGENSLICPLCFAI